MYRGIYYKKCILIPLLILNLFLLYLKSLY